MLLRSTLLYLPAQIFGPLFQLISVIAWTHFTSESTLGVITLVAATHELLQTLFLFWWSQYALRFFGSFHSPEDKARYYRTENAVLLLSVAVQSVIAMIILHGEIAPHADIALSVAVVGYVVTRSYNLYFAERARAGHEVGVYSLQQTAGPVFGFLLGLGFIHVLGDAPEGPIAGYALAQGAAAIATVPLIRSGWRIGPIDRPILRQALHYGLPLLAGGGLTWISVNASRFIVSDMLGVGAAGLFAVGYGLGFRATMFAAMLVTAGAFPLAIRKMEEGGSRLALRQLSDNGALLAAILFPGLAGLFVLRGEIVHVLIAAHFQAAALAILPIAALAGAIRNFRGHFADQVFLLHKRTRLLIVINGIEAALTVGLSIMFIRWWGLVGGVLANAVTASLAAVLSFGAGIVAFRLRVPVVDLMKVMLATLTMMGVLSLLPDKATAFALVSHVVLGGLIYAAVLAALYAPVLKKLRHQSSMLANS